MLSEEARARLVSTLAAEQPDANVTEQPEQTPSENQVEIQGNSSLEDGTTIHNQTDAPHQETKPEQKPEPKMVPLDEHIKERQRRKQYQSEIQALTNKVAQMEGYIAASERKPKMDPYLQSILGEDADTEDAPTPDPRDVDLAEIKAWKAEKQAQENQTLLTNVIAACKKLIPEVDDKFLEDQFILLRTPEQALKEWQRTHPAQTQAPQVTKAAPPPTVTRAPAGTPPKTNVATDWKSVSLEVKKRLAQKS